jgi:hypothetical protein
MLNPRLWWFLLMTVGGLGFGMLANKRPFGDQLLVHPLVIFFLLVGLALIALRVVLHRPVPEVISDRALVAGCLVGLAAFLAGNFLGVYGLSLLK